MKIAESFETDTNKLICICEAFKYILNTSTNYQAAYPADNDCGTILKLTKKYIHVPEVREIFDIALNSANYAFKSLATELLDENANQKISLLFELNKELLLNACNKSNWYEALYVYDMTENKITNITITDELLNLMTSCLITEYQKVRNKILNIVKVLWQ